jgi:hypothetical protein
MLLRHRRTERHLLPGNLPRCLLAASAEADLTCHRRRTLHNPAAEPLDQGEVE